MKHLPLR